MRTILKDYQWPCFTIKKKIVYDKKNKNKNPTKLRKKIEKFFSDKYGYDAFLYPSAKAIIGSILRFYDFNRSKEVFVNKWVSHCLFNTVGRYTNISTSYKNPDMIIAIHKWGFEQIFSKSRKIIIEDSVDSIILKKNKMFLNNSEFEFISLSKIVGSFSGGIIFTKNKKFQKFAKIEQNQNKEMGIYQTKKKIDDFNKVKSFDTFHYHESTNTYSDYNLVKNIDQNLKNFNINKSILIKRKMIINKIISIKKTQDYRLGPIAAIHKNKIKNHIIMKKYFLERHINKNQKSHSEFEKIYIVPLHFGISDQEFDFYCNIIERAIKK